MATLNEAKLKLDTPLDTDERNAVRRALGRSLAPFGADVLDESVFPADGENANKWLRAYLDDWDTISRAPSRLTGGADAIEYSTLEHQYVVYVDIAKALGLEVETYAVWSARFTEAGIQMVTITLGGLYARPSDEFAG